MPQKWSARQIEALETIVEHGRTLNYARLADLLDVTVPGFYYLLTPLMHEGYVEKVPTGLIVTRKGADVIAKVRNAERAIEDCILSNLDREERNQLFALLTKIVEPAEQEVLSAHRA
jgi:DNA-binding MarR family transcriptional regulator